MKTVVVTGSTKGIGRGLAEEFLKRGCNVVVCSRSDDAVGETVAALGAAYGAERVAGRACDVSHIDDLRSLWTLAQDRFGSVDIWINNAGMSILRLPLQEQAPEQLKALVDTNLLGVLYANQVALHGMHAQGQGQIWNMEGFGSGGQTAAGMAAYGATKSGLSYLTKSLQKEVKGTGVQVCTLSPGIVVTDLLKGDYDPASEEWEKAKKIFNILGDRVETVTPFLAEGVLKSTRTGSRVVWLTGGKAFARFLTAAFRKRDLFAA